jgi:hypothetical protein
MKKNVFFFWFILVFGTNQFSFFFVAWIDN